MARLLSVLLSIRDTATALGVCPDTVRRLAAAGRLRTVRVARRVMVPEAEVQRIVAEGADKRVADRTR